MPMSGLLDAEGSTQEVQVRVSLWCISRYRRFTRSGASSSALGGGSGEHYEGDADALSEPWVLV